MSLTPIIINISKSSTASTPEFMRRFAFCSNGLSNITKGEYKVVDENSYASIVKNSDNELAKWLKSFFLKGIGKSCVIIEVGSDDDATAQLKKLEEFIEGGVYPCWKYSLPSALYECEYLATLLDKYNDENKSVYFSANIEKDTDPTQGSHYSNWKGRKSFMAFYPSLQNDDYNLDGVITGIMASSAYDISTANTMSSLDYKKTSLLSKNLTSSRLSDIENANAVVTQSLGSDNVVFNSKFADGTYFHTYYAIDWTKATIEAQLQTLLVNASNLTNGAIPYNDSGIETIKQNINTTLNTLKSMQVINEFSSGYNQGTKTMTGVGNIHSEAFEDYIKANEEAYSKGIYGGYIAYIQIQQFIRQINFGINML